MWLSYRKLDATSYQVSCSLADILAQRHTPAPARELRHDRAGSLAVDCH